MAGVAAMALVVRAAEDSEDVAKRHGVGAEDDGEDMAKRHRAASVAGARARCGGGDGEDGGSGHHGARGGSGGGRRAQRFDHRRTKKKFEKLSAKLQIVES
uniref:DUF834 domain-containing protein n=1 Tax=Oryza rufipogon TaxID=4529 RepID=A0A0E0R6T7_ORYRU